MSDAYVGQIQVFAFNFAPRDWMFCNGGDVSESQYTALYALIGATYGAGAAPGSFKVPNASGRVLVGQGMAPGTSHNYQIGEQGGAASIMLTPENLPTHSHSFWTSTNQASTPTPPAGGVLAQGFALSESGDDSPVNLYAPADKNVQRVGGVAAVGAFLNVPVMNPYQVAVPCICLMGAIPPRPS